MDGKIVFKFGDFLNLENSI